MKQVKADVYAKVIQLRNVSKRIQQISWSLSKLEQKFDIDSITNNEELTAIMLAYTSLINNYQDDTNELNELTMNNETSKSN